MDPQDDAGRLFVLVQGMSFQSLVDPARWPPQRLRNVVDVELARLRHPAVGCVLRTAGRMRRTHDAG